MAKYLDGFVLVVPKSKLAEYKKMAKEGREVWMEHGALEYFECVGEDLKPQQMGSEKTNSFIKMAKTKPSETVWFSFILFKNKKHRDEVNKKVINAMSKKYENKKSGSMPFDLSRMAYGGFEVVVEGR